jgi:hypothetical protein
MIRLLLIAFGIISINVVLQAFVFIKWSDNILNNYINSGRKFSQRRELWILAISAFIFTILHVCQALIWATCYYLIPNIYVTFDNFGETLYFSLVTFTTLGYGDITIESNWRLLSGFEAINGIIVIGWTTAIMFSLIQKIYMRAKSK